MTASVISILNMKGGVGKTTLAAHVMRVLYHRANVKVLLLDVDAQFNLTQTVITQAQYDKILEDQNTILKCFEPLPSTDFFKVKSTDQPPPLASSFCTPLRKVAKGEKARLDIIPGSFNLMKYSMIDDPSQLKAASDHFRRFISQSKKEYDLVVLDCNPSSSFVTKCALDNSTHVLSPVKLDKYSILGVGMVDSLFDHLKLSPKHFILINDVRRSDPISAVESDLRVHPKFGPRVLVNRIAHSKLLGADPSYTGFASDRSGPYSGVVKKELNNVADEISAALGIVKK